MTSRNAAHRHLRQFAQLLVLMLWCVQGNAQTGPVGWWKLDEGTGTTAADSAAGAHNGTLTNSPTWSTGRVGTNALTFNGTTQSVAIGGDTTLANLYKTGMTISAWIKVVGAGGGTGGRIVDKDNNDEGWFFAMSNATAIRFTADQFTTAAGRTSSATIPANTWVHVAATWDGQMTANANFPAGIHIFINGTLADSTTVSNGAGSIFDDPTTPFTIGNRPTDNARGFNGSIDELRVYNRVLSAAEITALADPTAPTAPSGLAAVAASSTQINLNWTAATDNVGVTNYLVERCSGASCSTFTQIGTATGTSYSDSGLTASTSYSYRVRATDANSNLSAYSSTATVPTTNGSGPSWTQYTYDDAGRLSRVERDTGITSNYSLDPAGNRKVLLESNGAKPSAPTLNTPTAVSPTQVNLSWTLANTTGVSGYTVSRCLGASCTCTASSCPNFSDVATITGTPPATSYSDTGLISTTYYGYVVRARDVLGNISDPSNVATIRTLDGNPPDVAPVLSTPTVVSAHRIDLQWTAGHDDVAVVGYEVTRCIGPAFTSCTTTTLGNVLSYQDTGVADITTYQYRIRAFDARPNFSVYSNAQTATTPDGTAPSPDPSNLVATGASSTRINLTWTAAGDNVGVTKYIIERCSGAGCSSFASLATVTGAPPAPSFADGTVAPSSTYVYHVKAQDAAGLSSNFSAPATGTSLSGPPAVPTLTPFDQQVFSSSFSLVWTASPGATSYKIFASPSDTAGTYSLFTTVTNNSFTFTNVGLSDHFYEVEACNSTACSAMSNSAHVLVCSPTTGCP